MCGNLTYSRSQEIQVCIRSLFQARSVLLLAGFSAILGIDFDKAGGMYVLENTTGNPFPTPGTGDVIRIDPAGARRAIVTGLKLPTAMMFGPDNKLYISNVGFGPAALGGGEILKVSFSCANDDSHKESQ